MHTTSNEKALGTCDSKGLGTDTTNDLNFPTGQREGKAFATLAAQFALKGHAVHKDNGDDFIATRWGESRYCKDFAELQAFARQVGVKS